MYVCVYIYIVDSLCRDNVNMQINTAQNTKIYETQQVNKKCKKIGKEIIIGIAEWTQ